MKVCSFLFTLTAVIVLTLSTFAQKINVDVNALTNELQKDSPDQDELTLVWWIPAAYWRAVLQSKELPSNQTEKFIELLGPYTVVAVFDGRLNASAKAVFRTEADIRSNMRIVDVRGVEHAAIPSDKVGPGLSRLIDMVRPILTRTLGPVGDNFHFIVFPGLNSDREVMADPSKPGEFRVRLEKGRDFVWKLPLASLVPPKKCPVDGEVMNGNWRFCPFHGAELKN